MRAVVQRVSEARVRVDGATVGEVGPGLLVLLGAGHGDGDADATYLAKKIAGLRIFEDEDGKMNRSVDQIDGAGVLVVSQFTLYGDTRKGRRPSFVGALEPEEARRLVDVFVAALAAHGLAVQTGVFAAHMQVELVNDGPVTLILASRDGVGVPLAAGA